MEVVAVVKVEAVEGEGEEVEDYNKIMVMRKKKISYLIGKPFMCCIIKMMQVYRFMPTVGKMQ
jgi:hypothetical protein